MAELCHIRKSWCLSLDVFWKLLQYLHSVLRILSKISKIIIMIFSVADFICFYSFIIGVQKNAEIVESYFLLVHPVD